MTPNLNQHISSRANYRGQVNRFHRDIQNFSLLTTQEREVISTKLKRLQNELDRLDQVIQDLKWEENKSDETKATLVNDKEIEESSAYADRVSECLFALSKRESNAGGSASNVNPSLSLSMLKSATAPLQNSKVRKGRI